MRCINGFQNIYLWMSKFLGDNKNFQLKATKRSSKNGEQRGRGVCLVCEEKLLLVND